MQRTLLLSLNILAFLTLLAAIVLVYLFPSRLKDYGLNPELGSVLVLQVISFLLLLAGLQTNMATWWRRTALGASFVVLSESLLISAIRFL